MEKTESAIQWMESTANNDSHGYDQQYRWGEKGDYDCSSAVITAWQTAGVPVKTKGATYTGNMYSVFIACGFKDVTSQITLATGAGLVRGDVLLNHKNHTAMFCGNGKEVEASINENGETTGGQAGDQTGKEFLIRSYRNYPWDCVLRYTESTTEVSNTSAKKSVTELAQEVIDGKWGNGDSRKSALQNAGYDYSEVQAQVNAILNGTSTKTTTTKTVEQLAKEVINGDWGNGQDRKNRLTKAGYNYSEVQKMVNKILG